MGFLKKTLKTVFPPRIFHMLSHLSIRSKRLWVFGSHGGDCFADNPKYLYLYLSLTASNHGNKYIWISTDKEVVAALRKKGFEAFTKWSLQGLSYSLRAKYYFFSSYVQEINYLSSGGAVLVNLNHHVPLKKIEYDIKKGAKAGRFRLWHRMLRPYLYKKPDYILSTSRLVSKVLSGAHRVGRKNILEYGFPRTDIFFKQKSEQIEFIRAYESVEINTILERMRNYKKVLIYMPTWRDSGRDFLGESGIDFERLNSLLEEQGFLLLLKFHGNTELKPPDTAEKQSIVTLDNNIDVYPLLLFTDCLITDYSSTYIDYLLLDREIIFFPFDLDRYTTIDRELYFDYAEVTPGKKVYTYDELESTILDIDMLDYRLSRKKLRTLFWGDYRGDSCRRLCEFFFDHQFRF